MNYVMNFEKRKLLEKYLQHNIPITRIAKVLEVSRSTIYGELRSNLSDGAYKAGKYKEYDAKIAQERSKRHLMERWELYVE